MRRSVLAGITVFACAHAAQSPALADDWRVQRIDTPARVQAIETVAGQVQVNAGGLWYRVVLNDKDATLNFIDRPMRPKNPDGAVPDGRIAMGQRDIARAWFAEPTDAYDHGVLGDKIEASALVIERSDGRRETVKLNGDAVFEDLEPRLADLDGDGRDEIIVVKSYLRRGSALAVIAERKGKYEIVAETPPLGAPHQWLNPAGIGDFNGDGKTEIALVRQPHVVGALELWSWIGGGLRKTAELPDTANHIIGSRALNMSVTADFDGDKVTDIAVPSLDRSKLRLLSFMPAHEIASVPLPAQAVTNLGLVAIENSPPAVVLGLADGSLVAVLRN
jgi:hypothetical protein